VSTLFNWHNPDNYSGLISHLKDAQDFINANGGIDGEPARRGDENIEVLSTWAGGGSSGGGGSSACFISTTADGPPCHR
jgi:hypothetical protein